MNKKYHLFLIFVTILFLLISLIIFFIYKNNLTPSGDSYMAVLWSNVIKATGNVPDYSNYSSEWAKEGSVYFTPFLHILLGVFSMTLGIEDTVSILIITSILFVIFTFLMYSIGKLFDKKTSILIMILFILFSGRVLRYFSVPGYHYQNLFGDFLLVFMMFFLLKIIDSKENLINLKKEIFLIILFAISIYFTHQLSFLVSFFVILIPFGFIILTRFPKKTILIISIISLSIVFIIFIFTYKYFLELFHATFIYSDPLHLSEIKPLIQYPNLIVNGFLIIILLIGASIYFLCLLNKKLMLDKKILLLIYQLLIILVLTFGPIFHLNIPSLRILWYIEYPLIILDSIFLTKLLNLKINNKFKLLTIFLIILLIIFLPGGLNNTPYMKYKNFNNVFNTDSGFDPSLKNISMFIIRNSNENQTIFLDNTKFRSVLWIKSYLVPYKTFEYCEDFSSCPDVNFIIVRKDLLNNDNFKNYNECFNVQNISVLCKINTKK